MNAINIIRRLAAENSSGLAFVPDCVAAGITAAELLRLARDGAVELRPESGLGRLSAAERDACPRGYEGCVLSWARVA